MKKNTLILLSGGIDSTVLLANALENKKNCIALGFHYGQTHSIELEAAQKIADFYEVPFTILKIDPLTFNSSSLLSASTLSSSTLVMGRNLVFLSHAIAFGSGYPLEEIHIGCNADDQEMYADCRPTFIKKAQATLEAIYEDSKDKCPKIIAPLIPFNKKEIGKEGLRLKAPLDLTWSCYFPTKEKKPCTQCSACLLRKKALDFS